jgi:hypothetical protein
VIAVGVPDEGSEVFVPDVGSESAGNFGIGKKSIRLVLDHSQNDLKSKINGQFCGIYYKCFTVVMTVDSTIKLFREIEIEKERERERECVCVREREREHNG